MKLENRIKHKIMMALVPCVIVYTIGYIITGSMIHLGLLIGTLGTMLILGLISYKAVIEAGV